MEQIIKIDANQGTFDLVNKNTIDIDIPQNLGNVNLSESYLSIRTKVTGVVANQRAAGGGIVNAYIATDLSEGESLVISDTASIIANANFSSRKGRLEDLRRVGLLKNTLSNYNRDIAQIQSVTNGLGSFEMSRQSGAHQTQEISRVDDITSREVNHEIQIPLKNIFNCCKSDGFDTSIGGHGRSRIHLEMDFNKLGVEKNFVLDDTVLIEGSTAKMTQYNPTATAVGTQSITNITSASELKNPANCVYYVGQYINVKYDTTVSSAATGLSNQTVITDIQIHGSTNNRVTITFADAIALIANQGMENVTIVDNALDTTNSALDILGVQLVTSISNEPAPAVLNYTTYQSEEDSYPASTSANRMYQVPPAVKNVYIMFFEDSGSTEQRSFNEHLDTYRVTLDNKELVPRPVKIGGRIHKDLISQVFANNGENIKSLRETQRIHGDQLDIDSLDATVCRMIAFPIPFKASPTQLQLELNAIGGNLTGHHILFYEKVVQV